MYQKKNLNEFNKAEYKKQQAINPFDCLPMQLQSYILSGPKSTLFCLSRTITESQDLWDLATIIKVDEVW